MSPNDPPELPRLPPIRESAEQALPSGFETGLDFGLDAVEDEPNAASRHARREKSSSRRRSGSEGSTLRPTAPRPSPPRRERRPPRREPKRPLASAGHALVVSVLALVFATLLMAPGMHKAAFNGQPGLKRDVSLALTGGLASTSDALFLDRPRQAIQSLAGRSGEDNINVAVVIPKTTPKPIPKPPSGKIAFTPKKKLRLWVAGDSLVIVPGYSIVRAAAASPVIESVGGVDGHIATGLTRPDVFNWFTRIDEEVKRLKPKVVVLNFGGNDDKGYMTGLPQGTSIGSFASPSWTAEYRRRVAGVMNTVNRAGGVVVWIGLPITRSPEQTLRFDTLNAIVQKEAKSRPGRAIFVDTYTMFAGNNGGYTEYLENATGDTVKVRAGDGVHFDPAGGDLIARDVLKRLNELFDLTSWRKKQTAA